eukprot:gene10229-1848_t
MAGDPVVQDNIRIKPDFPKPGIAFVDIMPLLKSPQAFQHVIDRWVEQFKDCGATAIVGLESRGFLLGAPLALALKLPFVAIRKPGKLPPPVHSVSFEKEYGKDSFEVQTDAVPAGAKIIIIDDILATGGTLIAAIQLITDKVAPIGAEVVGIGMLLDIPDLPKPIR